MSDRRLAILSDAIADGEHVDWTRVTSGLASAQSRAVAEQLRTLGAIVEPARPAAGSRSASERNLPVLLDGIRLLAAAITAVGAVGTLASETLDAGDLLRLTILAAFGATALLLARGARHRAAAALGGAYWTIAAAFAVKGTGEFFRIVNLGWAGGVLDALRPEAFLAAFFWLFVRDFPAVTRFSALDRFTRAAYRLSVAVGVVLFAINVLPALVNGPGVAEWTRPFDRVAGRANQFWGLEFGAIVPALFIIPLRSRHASADERARVRAFLLAIALGLLPMVAAVLAEIMIPAVARTMESSVARFWVGAAVYLPMLAMPLVTAYAVAAYGILDVRAAVREGLGHLLARWVLAWSTTGAVLTLIIYVYAQRHHSIVDVLATARAQVLLPMIAGGVLLAVFTSRVMRAIDTWAAAGAGPGEQDAMLALLSEHLKTCRTPLELASAFTSAVARGLRTTADVYVPTDRGLAAVSAEGGNPPQDSLIPLLMRGAAAPCLVEPAVHNTYYPLLTSADRRWIDDRALAVVVPLTTGRPASELFACVALQCRGDGRSFSHPDLRFLTTASAAVQFAADALQRDRIASPRDPEELGAQCRGCGRVETWRPVMTACECGGAWGRAALPPLVAGRFTVESALGSGGMGVVYRGIDRVLHRTVAIKTLPTLRAEAAARLIGEARAMAALSHQHIAVLYSIETWQDTPVLVMEYLSGGTVATRLQRGPLEPSNALGLVMALAAALEHVHAAGWYHGDIKPSNIGFTQTGVPKFLDFGLSRAWNGSEAPHAGTLPYLSPEVLQGAPAGPLLDLWALSVVLFEGLTGVHPFMDESKSHVRVSRGLNRALRARCPQLRNEFWSFFEEALAPDPIRRPQNAADFVRRLHGGEK